MESWKILWVRIFARFSRRFCLKPSRPLKFCDFAIALRKLILVRIFNLLYQSFEEQQEAEQNSLPLRWLFQFFQSFVFLDGIFFVIGNSDHSHLCIFSVERVTKFLTFFCYLNFDNFLNSWFFFFTFG